jgi:hypothetical protein
MRLEDLEAALIEAVRGHAFWEPYLVSRRDSSEGAAIHLAVFVEPFLEYVLNGTKTVESRFSANRVAPYASVKQGDIVLLKASGGPVVGLCRAADVWSYRLQTTSWSEIRNRFAHAMCAEDPEFWETRSSAGYATLIRIVDVLKTPAIPVAKSDRRGWVVLSAPTEQFEMLSHT